MESIWSRDNLMCHTVSNSYWVNRVAWPHLILDWWLLHCQPGRDDHAYCEACQCFSTGLAYQLTWGDDSIFNCTITEMLTLMNNFQYSPNPINVYVETHCWYKPSLLFLHASKLCILSHLLDLLDILNERDTLPVQGPDMYNGKAWTKRLRVQPTTSWCSKP